MIAAILSAVLCAVSLPTALWTPWYVFKFPDLGLLAWFSLVPFYLSLYGASPREALRRGFVWGFFYFGIAFYWMFIALSRYGEAPLWASLLGWAAAVALIAVFPAVFGWIFCRYLGHRAVFFPLLWVVFEFIRNFFPWGGFPWANLAYSQSSFLPFIQILDLFGVYGVLFILVFANAALAEVCIRKKAALPFLGIAVLLVGGSLVYGHFREKSLDRDWSGGPTLRVGLVQANIPQDQKWLQEKVEDIIKRHMELTRGLEKQKPDLVIWPEASYPAMLPPEFLKEDLKIPELQKASMPLLMGVVRYEGFLAEEFDADDDRFTLFNSAILVAPGGRVVDWYDKVHLVPMGEYIPFKIPFLNKITPAAKDFTPGGGFRLVYLGEKPPSAKGIKMAVTICYEDLFPQISSMFARQNPDFMVNLTNDGWYESSSAVFQHLDFSRFRAIETRRSMVRATNTGVTAVFDRLGRITATLPPFEEATQVAEVSLGGPLTIYTRSHDAFAWVCVAAVLGMLLAAYLRQSIR